MNGVVRNHGVTLIELLIVVSILGVVALVAIPNLSSTGAKHLDLATAEIVTAIRYARSEAMRTGEVHGIEIDKGNRSMVVYKADLSTNPVGKASILTHPVDHKPYFLHLDTAAMMAGVSIANEEAPFLFLSGRNKSLLYNATGWPVWIDAATGVSSPLLEGLVLLDHGALVQAVRVSRNGRVSIK